MSYRGPLPSTYEFGAELIHRLNHGDGPPCDECKGKAEQVLNAMYRRDEK